MIKALFLSLLFSSFAFANSYREDAELLLARNGHVRGTINRLDTFSGKFIGFPYGKNGPLGEGVDGLIDQDPLYRFDTFDCTTYVETIMALALTRDVNDFEKTLDQIRYKDGVIGYLSRNHFTDLQWIPFNIENGMMEDITTSIYPKTKTAEALINYPAWIKSIRVEQLVLPLLNLEEKKARLAELHNEARYYTPKIATLPYIAIKDILDNPKILNQIPHGAVVNFVRPNWDLTREAGTHQNISHQGFLFRTGRILYLRHASTTGKVENVLFLDYLKKFANHPTLKGIHLMKINPREN